MIVGMGIDLVEIERIRTCWERFGQRFADKILTEAEKRPLAGRRDPVPYLAAMFAAKEAAVKALGTGFRDGVHPHVVEVRHLPSGKPELFFLGKALERFQALGGVRAHVSLTHERSMAAAVAVIEADSNP